MERTAAEKRENFRTVSRKIYVHEPVVATAGHVRRVYRAINVIPMYIHIRSGVPFTARAVNGRDGDRAK